MATHPLLFHWKFNFTFDADDICTATTIQITFPTAAMAQQYYNENKNDLEEGQEITYNPGSIVVNCVDPEYAGMSRAELKDPFLWLAE